MSLAKNVEKMSILGLSIHWAQDAQPYYMFGGTFLQLGAMKIDLFSVTALVKFCFHRYLQKWASKLTV